MNDIVIEIAAYSVFAFALTLLAVQLIAGEIGFRLGLRKARDQEAPREGIGVVVGGMLGLFAFILALTLSHSSGRFQERRDGMLAEANVIGTSWLRAQAVGGPRGAEIARLICRSLDLI